MTIENDGMMEVKQEMLSIGAMLQGGKYCIERYLASGGFGNTYLAKDTSFDEQVVIKEFYLKGVTGRDGDSVTVTLEVNRPLFDSQLKKFTKEAKRLRKLEHINIVRVHDLFQENGTSYYVMDFIDGESMASRVKRNGAMSEAEVRAFLPQLLDALETVHAQEILHLDLKPGNIMVDGSGRLRLIDFGASKQTTSDGTATTTTGLAYTPGFAPPEQMHGQMDRVGSWTDLYSLGATLYYLLTAQTPPDPNDIYDSPDEAFRFSEAVSPAMRGFVKWLMQPNYRLRPQTVAAVRQHLQKDTTVAEQEPMPVYDEATRLVALSATTAAHWQSESQNALSNPIEEETKVHATSLQPEEPIEDPEQGNGKKKGKRLMFIAILAALLLLGSVWIVFRSCGTSQIKQFTVNGVSFEMVPVEGGTFDMGATPEQKEPSDVETPAHKVALSSYMIGKTEVTQELWEAVMGSNPSKFKGADLPVECVSWDDCQEFIKRLNAITGERFRLPTEAEWEFASRGGNKSRHTQYSGSNNIGVVAWYADNSGDKTHPVGTKAPNELGLYDMSGNVWEWCQDWFGDYPRGGVANPKGPSSASYRVFRGGGCILNAQDCRVATRSDYAPDFCSDCLGFRLAL